MLINAKKSFFDKPELKYLGCGLTHEGVKPAPKKVEAIHNTIAPPKIRRNFLGSSEWLTTTETCGYEGWTP